jgi:hypothetical protein
MDTKRLDVLLDLTSFTYSTVMPFIHLFKTMGSGAGMALGITCAVTIPPAGGLRVEYYSTLLWYFAIYDLSGSLGSRMTKRVRICLFTCLSSDDV